MEVIKTKEEIQDVQSKASAGWNLHEGRLDAVYSEAAAGWQRHQDRLDGLHEGVKTALEEVRWKIQKVSEEQGGGGGLGGGFGGKGGSDRFKGYLPIKSMVPWAMRDDITQWRRWKAKVLTYTECLMPGMKSFLHDVGELKHPPGKEYVAKYALEKDKMFIPSHATMIYAALLEITEGGAWNIVDGVADEDGYVAWFELHKYFEAALSGRQGQAYADLNAMTKMKAKDPLKREDL